MIAKILPALDSFPYFTIEAVKQLLGDEYAAGSIPTALYRWMRTGQVIQLKKGIYMTRRFHDLHATDADFPLAVSAILIPNSYVSLEFILQAGGILTEVTHPVTAVTQKQTRVIQNTLGTFSYRHIRDVLYTGFTFSNYQGIPFARASLAKSLFDHLYFRPFNSTWRSPAHPISEDLRLNLDEFSATDRREFAGYVASSRSAKMSLILNNLEKTVWHP